MEEKGVSMSTFLDVEKGRIVVSLHGNFRKKMFVQGGYRNRDGRREPFILLDNGVQNTAC